MCAGWIPSKGPKTGWEHVGAKGLCSPLLMPLVCFPLFFTAAITFPIFFILQPERARHGLS